MTQGSTMAISCNQEKNNMPKDILCIAQLNQYLKSKYEVPEQEHTGTAQKGIVLPLRG